MTQSGAYVARVWVAYRQGEAIVTAVDDNEATVGWRRVIEIPADATSIRLQAWSATGVAGDPWKTVVSRTWSSPPRECVKVLGTALEPQATGDCA